MFVTLIVDTFKIPVYHMLAVQKRNPSQQLFRVIKHHRLLKGTVS